MMRTVLPSLKDSEPGNKGSPAASVKAKPKQGPKKKASK